VLQRGEKIELLVDKTEQLSQSARKFQKQSKALKNVMWCKNVKMWVLIAFVLIIIAWLISSFVCGFDYSNCKGSSSK
jgi:vesicle-associated membrane protein 7